MRGRAVWLWCIAFLVGCEASVQVESRPMLPVNKPVQTQRGGIVELRKGSLLAHVSVARGGKVPVTFTLLENLDDRTSFVSRTEHDCKARTSTLKYLVAYDADMNATASTVDTKIVMEPGSISEAQLNLACAPKEGPNV